MSKLEDKLAASLKTGRGARAADKPAPTNAAGKKGARKSADAQSVPAAKPAAAFLPEPVAADPKTLARDAPHADAERPLHPRRVWPD